MVKRIILCVLALSLVLSGISVFAYTDTEGVRNEKAINLITGLKLIQGYDDGTFLPDKEVTRAEFAAILDNMTGGNGMEVSGGINWESEYLTPETDGAVRAEITAPGQLFADVPMSHWAYDIVNSVYTKGLMSGMGGNLFDPDSGVTYIQAIKTFLNMAGYSMIAKQKGGYPQGWMTLATDNVLSSGTGITDYDAPLTRGQVVQILYNMLKVHVVETDFKHGEPAYRITNESFMNEVLGIYEITGVVTATDTASISGAVQAKNRLIINNSEKLFFNEADGYLRGYLGMTVSAYYKEDDDGLYVIQYAEPKGRQTVTCFKAEDIISYENGLFEYGSGSSIKRVRAGTGAVLIYNGEVIESYDASIFDIKRGDVEIIQSASGDTNDIIIVNSYETVFVSVVDDEDQIIINKLAEGDSSNLLKSFKVDEDDNRLYEFVYADGTAGSFEDISQGMVLSIMESKTYVRIIMSSARINGTVQVVSADADGGRVTIDETEYDVAGEYVASPHRTELKSGNSGVFYLDAFGRVVWYDSEISTENIGYMVKGVYDTGEDSVYIKYYDMDKGGLMTVVQTGSVSFRSADGNSSKINGSTLAAWIENNSRTLFKFSKDENGQFKSITMAMNANSTGVQSGLRTMIKTTDNQSSINYYANFPYKTSVKTLGAKLFLTDNTKILVVPESGTAENEFKMMPVNTMQNSKTYKFDAYNTDKLSPVAQYVVITRTGESEQILTTEKCIVVDKISEGIDNDGEHIVTLYGNQGNNDVEIISDYSFTDRNGNECSAFALATDIFNTRDADGIRRYPVRPGDIIRCSYDEVTGYVRSVQVIYRPDSQNPAWDESVMGSVPGCSGEYRDTNQNSNPFAVNGSGDLITGAGVFNKGQLTFHYGFVQSVYSDYVTLTTQDLYSNAYNPNMDYTRTYYASRYSITKVKYNGSKYIETDKGSITDFRSHEEVGKGCSRAIIISSWGDPYQIILIQDQSM